MDEFSLIKKYFSPLAKDFPGSLNLTDDAAILDIPAGQELIVTKDAISEGVHFIGNEDPALIAKKLLRVNLSDLAAMGASPLCYFLALMIPPSLSFPRPGYAIGALARPSGTAGLRQGEKRESITNKMDPRAFASPKWLRPRRRVKPEDDIEEWIASFAQGLAEDQQTFSIHLAGGDTTATKHGMSFSITALGLTPKGKAIKRSGARPGDHIYVSGTIGDGALGLLSLQKNLGLAELEQRYLLPEPRVALGQKLIGIANACIDVSDGLIQDLGHICNTSRTGAEMYRHLVPLSLQAASSPDWDRILGGGDDYELLFTTPLEKEAIVARLSSELKLPLTRIGTVTDGKTVLLLDAKENALPLPQGYKHF